MSYTMDPVIHLVSVVILVNPLSPVQYQHRCLKVQDIIEVKNLSHFVRLHLCNFFMHSFGVNWISISDPRLPMNL